MVLNNENSLALAALESIGNIGVSTREAERSVGSALIDLYIKEAEIISYSMLKGREVIQESWFDYKKGESLFKTILLLIPRIIVAMFKNITGAFERAWDDAEKAEKDYQKSIEEAKQEESNEFEQKINSMYSSIRNIKAVDGKLYYSSRIRDFEELKAYIGTFASACKNYRDAVKDIDIESFLRGEVGLPDELVNVFHYNVGREIYSAICPDNERNEFEFASFMKEFKELNKVVDAAKKAADKSMSDVTRIYEKMTKDSIVYDKSGFSNYAERMLKDFRTLHDDLDKVLIVCAQEKSDTEYTSKAVKDVAEQVSKLRRERRKKELFEEKMADAQDDYEDD